MICIRQLKRCGKSLAFCFIALVVFFNARQWMNKYNVKYVRINNFDHDKAARVDEETVSDTAIVVEEDNKVNSAIVVEEDNKVKKDEEVLLPEDEVIDDEPLACNVPVLDPYHPLVTPYIEDHGTDLRNKCRSMHPQPPPFIIVDNKLVLRPEIGENRIPLNTIELKEVQRNGDFAITYAAGKNPFQGTQGVRESKEMGDEDFFRLYYDMDGERLSDLYARIAPKVGILEKQIKRARNFAGQGIPLNVLVIGFDSTSRANFVRKMGGVISFLKTRMNTHFMEGMSIVGDATTPALTAMLTGKYLKELPEGRRAFNGKPIDDWPWIMKEYEERGYMTLYSEDTPSIGAFNLRLLGFKDCPVHHYMRPFWISKQGGECDGNLCCKSDSRINVTLNYVMNFFDSYPEASKFSFSFFSRLTHGYWNDLSYAENDVLGLLRTFVAKGYHEKTMVIIMGDHGVRDSKFRGTVQGKLEERLPWFSVSLPSSFHRLYPDLVTNLRHNQAIISSPFDVHATFRHILTYPKVPRDEFTQSLFTKLPRNRTCIDAGVAEHWCPCIESSPVNVTSEQVRKVALATVDHINNELSKFPVLETSCHRLTLDSVQDAVLLQANKRLKGNSKDVVRYQVIFTTKPNDAGYEATVSVSSDGGVKVNPEISRINTYSDQPKCILEQYPHARKFCYCKT